MSSRSRSSRHVVLLLGALVLGCALLTLLWSRTPRSAVERAPSSRSSQRARAAIAGEQRADGAADSAANASPQVGREHLLSEEPPAAAEPSLRDDEMLVLVRHAVTHEPAANLELHWYDIATPAGSAIRREYASGEPIDSVMSRLGERTHTDAAGRARVPYPIQSMGISARSGGALAFEIVDRGGVREPVLLELHEQGEFAVRVVDARGNAAARVRVGLGDGAGAKRNFYWTGTTDAAGLARCANFRNAAVYSRASRFTVALAFPSHGVVEQEIDAYAPPREPPVLVLPETGALNVHVVHADGSAAEVEGLLYVQPSWKPPQFAGGAQQAAEGIDQKHHHYSVRGGRCRVPHVAVGLDLVINLAVDGFPWAERVTISGPRYGGEEVVARVTLPAHKPRVLVRVLDADGAPLAGAWLGATATPKDAQSFKYVQADERGLAELWPTAFDVLDAHRYRDVLVVQVDGAREIRAWRGGLDPTGAGAGGILCDIRLEPRTPTLSGRVVDARTGAAVARARVVWKKEEAAAESVSSPLFDGAVQIRDLRGWSQLECAVDGSYALREAWNGALRIVARCDGYADSEPITVLSGSSPPELVLEPAGELSGSFAFRATADPMELACVLIEQQTSSTTGVRVEIEDDGTFTCRRLRPGRYSLLVAAADHVPPCLRIDDVEVRAGAHARDPRLQRIDLAGVLHDLRIQVLRPDGGPLEDAEITLIEDRAPVVMEGESYSSSSDGYANLWSTQQTVDLVVVAKAMRVEHVRSARDGAIVRMRPELPIEIELAGAGQALNWANLRARHEGGLDMRVQDTLGSDHGSLIAQGSGVPRKGPVALRLSASGQWRVSGVTSLASGITPLRFAGGSEHVLIEVLDDPEPQRFVLALEPRESGAKTEGGK